MKRRRCFTHPVRRQVWQGTYFEGAGPASERSAPRGVGYGSFSVSSSRRTRCVLSASVACTTAGPLSLASQAPWRRREYQSLALLRNKLAGSRSRASCQGTSPNLHPSFAPPARITRILRQKRFVQLVARVGSHVRFRQCSESHADVTAAAFSGWRSVTA